MMVNHKFLFGTITVFSLLLWGCGPAVNNYGGGGPSGVYVTSCGNSQSVPLSGTPNKMALDNVNNVLYVLDDYSGISRWTRLSYDCGWELDESWETGGAVTFDGFLQDLDLTSAGALFVKDGTQMIGMNMDTCAVSVGDFAVSPDGTYLVISTSAGSQIAALGGNVCPSSSQLFGYGKALTVDVDGSGFETVESVGGSTPQRLVAYGPTGNVRWTSPLSVVKGVEPYLCSADRIRSNDFEEVVLDRTCHRLVSFDASGNWIASISLDSLGIGGGYVHDMAQVSTGVVELLYDGYPLTVQVSWRSLLGQGLAGVVESTSL